MRIADIIESRGHKVIATKLANMDRMKTVEIPTPQQRRNYDDARDTVKKPVDKSSKK